MNGDLPGKLVLRVVKKKKKLLPLPSISIYAKHNTADTLQTVAYQSQDPRRLRSVVSFTSLVGETAGKRIRNNHAKWGQGSPPATPEE